jgi:toxin ParE1/3/4
MKPLHIAPIAEDELREARTWYEAQGLGLGRRFVDGVDAVLAGIQENPLRFPVVHEDIRRAIVRRFPYGVFVRDRIDDVFVIAIVHLHRHPDTWKRRG